MTTLPPDEASNLFDRGFYCSQAILCAYSEMFGLDKDTACKIATPFGAGIGWTGNMCGAVAGALMVIGLKYGNTDPDDMDAKKKVFATTQQFQPQTAKKVFATTQQFVVEFMDKNASINCTDLLGYDL
ncbi:MAG TPA: C-GCAxxG-C-C family protein, partial [Methanoregulaceae archaeon]|nr:C-GCAxxG-C-C family protein [Methanoregulaceae archaeon]